MALQCGRADWKQFLSEIDPEELDYILALSTIEPVLREDREDMRTQFMTAALMRCWGAEISPADLVYFGQDDDEDESVTVKSSEANVLLAFGAVGVRRA